MKRDIYEINKKELKEVSLEYYHLHKTSSSVFIYDINISDRSQISDELRHLNFEEEIIDAMLHPSKHIRFETIGKFTYGEIAILTKDEEDPIKYMAVTSSKNTLFFINESQEGIIDELDGLYQKQIRNLRVQPNVFNVLYILLYEMLTAHAQLILDYRDEIEAFSNKLEEKKNNITPQDFLLSKGHLSDLTRVVEKWHFSMNFPPGESLIDTESAYNKYFSNLLKLVDNLKVSLVDTYDRLESLHDHYMLMMQQKSNTRLKFLTIVQAIFVPLTLIAGIYGMNFANMPELNSEYAYFIVLGLMSVVALLFLFYFKKHGWFDKY